MNETFNPNQLDVLRGECAKIERIDPLSPTYRKMIALLNGMSITQLKQIRHANIKFLSRLALNRINPIVPAMPLTRN